MSNQQLTLSSHESRRRTAANYEATAKAAMNRAMHAISKRDLKAAKEWLELANLKVEQAEALRS